MKESEDEIEAALPDYAVYSVQLLSAVLSEPVLGTLLGGTAALGLARVRARNLLDFGAHFRARLGSIEARVDRSEDRLEVLEAAAEAAARSASENRRRYLAELAARALTTEELGARPDAQAAQHAGSVDGFRGGASRLLRDRANTD